MLAVTICEMAQTRHSLWVLRLCIVIDIWKIWDFYWSFVSKMANYQEGDGVKYLGLLRSLIIVLDSGVCMLTCSKRVF